jgi:hypothetical protein
MLVYTESDVGMTEYNGGWKQYEPSPICASWAAITYLARITQQKITE